MMIRLRWFVAVLVWAVMATILGFVWNPLPIPDRGHRCFAVPSEDAAKVVVSVLEGVGLSENFTFDAGPTHQTLLSDNETVIISHDQVAGEQQLPPNGLSVVVGDPRASAKGAAAMLERAGFTAFIKYDLDPMLGDKLVVLQSSAFDGWVLVFRRHVLVMGKPPNQRQLMK